MSKYLSLILKFLCLIFIVNFNTISAQNLPYNVGNKLLVVSGGGARGAWGVGLIDTLVKMHGGYKVVMGVSTGSTMAPLILLQKFDKLTHIYTSVSQKDIFNINPFKVKVIKDTVKTEPRLGLAAWRLIWGKKTIGETKNFRKLIDKFFIEEDFNTIKKYNLEMGVGVTNMQTGMFELKLIKDNSYNRMKDWIWASANQPLWMSYVNIDGADYVDGGVRKVIPFEDAIKYSIDNQIDTIDVVVNNSFDPLVKGWKANKGSWFNGLVRVLEIYGVGTHQNSIQMGEILGKLYNCQVNSDIRTGTVTNIKGKDIIINIYFMPHELADTYRDDLGFDKSRMKAILEKGKRFFIQSKDEGRVKLKSTSRAEIQANPNIKSFRISSDILQNSFIK